RLEQCERCGGDGAEPGSKVTTCPQCNGRGEVRQVQQSVFGRFVNVSTCPRCGGAGKTVDKVCTRCRGEGRERKERDLSLNIPAGAQHGQTVRLRGKGVPHLHGSGRGDQLVYLDVVIPRTLTKDQKTLYQKLHAASGIPEQADDDRGVFERIKDALI